MKQNNNPIISVVMPVYNAENYLDKAMQSILKQTYKDFEFIIINDGSTDRSLAIIKEYMKHDERIVLISRENKGLIYSLNEGIKKAKGKYIARMDADDISLKNRFEKQVSLMQIQELDICGSHYFIVNETGNYVNARVVSCDTDFNALILCHSVPFAHGSVMIKKEFLNKNNLYYGETLYNKAEDYALWIQAYEFGAKISNVDEFLFKYRDINASLSSHPINAKHAKKLSFLFIEKHYNRLFNFIKVRENFLSQLNPFEQEQLSYFLLKSLFRGELLVKLRFLKSLTFSSTLLNLIRIVSGK